jgi:hypothetical protein
MTIDQSDNIVPKIHINNDQTHSVSGIPSVNDRTLEAELTPDRFGRALLGLIHYTRLHRLSSAKPIGSQHIADSIWRPPRPWNALPSLARWPFSPSEYPLGVEQAPVFGATSRSSRPTLATPCSTTSSKWGTLMDEICSPVVSSIPPPYILPRSVTLSPAKPITAQ